MRAKPYVFIVEPVMPNNSFPLDMLRYDSAWPVDSTSVAHIHDGQGLVMLATYARPTKARWLSFGWKVTY